MTEVSSQKTGPATEDILIDVPMNDKDLAKSYGARPMYKDKKFVSWYIPKGRDVEPFAKWLPVAPGEGSMTLTQLMSSVKRAVSTGMPGRYWVTAEILQVSSTRHTYLELTDTDGGGAESAKARASIWASKSSIIDNFEKETGQKLSSGTRVMLQVEVDYHERFGLGLVVQAIDPRFTVGEMALRVAKIRGDLIRDGLYGLNKQLSAPKDFHRLVVLAPEQAAGLGDFRKVADLLQASGICEFTYVHSPFQGDSAMELMARKIEQIGIRMQSNEEGFDALVIIRGGGDKAGIYQLNDFMLASAVCRFPVPVLIGIGHERDETILNEVGNTAFATPSMVAQHIYNRIVQNVQLIREEKLRLHKASERLISIARQFANEEFVGLKQLSQEQISEARMLVDSTEKDIKHSSKALVVRARNVTKELMGQILHQDPSKIIGRGYIVAKDSANHVVADQAGIVEGDAIILRFRDGERSATVNN
jgi:exodeoxyribonuclease VII large subunit